MKKSYRLPDGNDSPLPSHEIESDGSIIWEGEPLKFSHLQSIIYAIRSSSGLGYWETVENAKPRWITTLELATASLARLHSEEVLRNAVETLPELPKAPAKPKKKTYFRVGWDPNSINLEAYEKAMANWKTECEAYEIAVALHEAFLPEMQKRVSTWKKYGGIKGIEKIIGFRERLNEFSELLRNRIENPELLSGSLPFELLPPGLWNYQRLIAHLGGRNWRIQESVPERLQHFFALNPIKVFEGDMHRDYREYFIFLFSNDGSAVLESPFHGNATYLLRSDWFALCQRTKGELIGDKRAERVIHRDIPSWRREICTRLGKRMPGHSNEY